MESKLFWAVIENAVCIFEGIMLLMFFSVFFEKKHKKSIIYLIIAIGFGLFFSFLNTFKTDEVINLILLIGISLMIVFLNYNGKLLNKILATILFIVIWFTSEVVVAMVLATGFNIDLALITQQQTGYRLITMFLAKTVLLLIIKIIERFKTKNTHQISINYWFLLLFVPVFSSFTMLSIFFVLKNSSSQEINGLISAIAFVGLLYTNIIVFYLFENIVAHEGTKYKLYLIENQMNIQEKHYLEMNENIKETRRVWHDLKHYILSLKMLITQKEYPEAINYLNKFEALSDEIAIPSYSGNNILDAVLWQKYVYAGSKGISVSYNVVINSEINIEAQDICALFGNAIDNAIEACEPLDSENIEKRISLNIASEKSFFRMDIKNPILSTPKTENGKFLTTKKDAKNHGIGLESIKKITEKYKGIFKVDTFSNEFALEIILNM